MSAKTFDGNSYFFISLNDTEFLPELEITADDVYIDAILDSTNNAKHNRLNATLEGEGDPLPCKTSKRPNA